MSLNYLISPELAGGYYSFNFLSAAAERVFSILSNSFSSWQEP